MRQEIRTVVHDEDLQIEAYRFGGWVRNIGRAGQERKILTLAQLREERLDMFTTVFIGNSATGAINGWMVTPRGYRP